MIINARQALVVCCTWLFASASYAALDTQVRLAEQPKSLANSLITLGRESDISIVFSSRLLEGKLAPASVNSQRKVSTLEALRELLTGSGLGYKIINAHVIAITPLKSGSSSAEHYSAHDFQEELSVIEKALTGSRIKRNYLSSASPVDVISQPELAASGAQSLGEFLKFIPSVVGNSTSTAVSNGGDGTATVTLRGLPANNTLVLINGQRAANAGLAGDAIDLNSIPPAAVERIEILKDGASAVYGSDAIAGVVNVILRHNFDGFQLEQFYGETSRQDLETTTTNLLWGSKSETASVMVAASYFNQGGIYSRDREISRSADNRALGGTDLRSSATPNGRFTLADGTAVTVADEFTGANANEFRVATAEDLFNFSAFNSSTSPSSRASIYSIARIELSPNVSVFTDLSYTATDATITLASSPVFTGFESQPIVISSSNRYNPFNQDINDGRKRLIDLGLREQRNQAQAYRLNWGLEGDDNELRWQLNQFWSRTNASVDYTNLISGTNLRRALGDDAACLAIDGCVALNMFGPQGSIDDAMLDYIRVDTEAKGNSQLYGFSFDFDKSVAELPAGELLFAAGVEIRRESTRKTPKPQPVDEFLIGGGETSVTEGSRSIYELFTEMQIPLLADTTLARQLDLEIATRFSHYSDFGDAATPKVGLRYAPIQDLFLRATYSRGFRAPSLSEIHRGGQLTQAFLIDPCSDPVKAPSLPGCSAVSDSTRTQFLTIFGGSTELKPERATNKTLGAVWTPSELPGLSTNLDFYWIDQSNVVDASAQYILNQNAATNEFAGRVKRNAAGEIEQINATFINIGKRAIKGIDFGLKYQHLLDEALLTYSINAANLRYYRDQQAPDSPPTELAGTFSDEAAEGSGALPKWKANTGLQWKQEQLDLHYTINFISALDEFVARQNRSREIDRWITHDIQLNYKLAVQRGLTLTLGADNLLDQAAPFAATAFNDSIDSRTHDLRGRYWYGRVSLNF